MDIWKPEPGWIRFEKVGLYGAYNGEELLDLY